MAADGSALPPPSSATGDLRGGLDRLHVEGEVDAVADQEAAGLEDLVPRQAEVLAADRAAGGERGTGGDAEDEKKTEAKLEHHGIGGVGQHQETRPKTNEVLIPPKAKQFLIK
mgnify:CR=1 FL=1